MALAVFMFAMVVIPTKNLGGFGAWIKDFCFGLFGFCAYVFPFVLGYIAVMLAIEKEKGIILSEYDMYLQSKTIKENQTYDNQLDFKIIKTVKTSDIFLFIFNLFLFLKYNSQYTTQYMYLSRT